ncbi:MAG: 4-alpha-glucanotransferase [Treponema sp.]
MLFSALQQPCCGAAVPVSALKSEKSCGIGEFSDLIPFADFCKKAGLGIIQLLPINDTGTDSSPYNALSAFALHPVFIRLQDIPEAKKYKDEIEVLIAKTAPQSDTERFNYRKILHEKNTMLHTIFNDSEKKILKDAESGKLADWITDNPWIIEYAVFKNNKRQNYHASWKEWNTMRFPSEAEIVAVWNKKELRREHLFYAWVQMHLDNQLRKAVAHCREKGIAVKGDIPILMNEDSVEVWAHPEYFRSDLRAGSPPDGDNPSGQNWGFPIYNWSNLRETGYDWWKRRLQYASRYYDAYRLDHILGFFRIWAIPEGETTGFLGKPLPYSEITADDLQQAGFSKERIRWIAEPHVPTYAVQSAVHNDYLYAHGLLHRVMDRIGGEELWLFKPEIKKEADIYKYDLPPQAAQVLAERWHDRMLVPAGKSINGAALYTVACRYMDTTAWHSLSEHEKHQFSVLAAEKEEQQNILWKNQAMDILSALCTSTDMQPCAEDLGVNLSVLPAVLNALNIYSLRVFRWERKWNEPGSPFIPLCSYPKTAVSVTSVHDSSTLRQWWNAELRQDELYSFLTALAVPAAVRDRYCAGEKPVYNEEIAAMLLGHFVKSPALLPIFPIQDWLSVICGSFSHISAAEERINVPGTVSASNWTYRLPLTLEAMNKHKELIKRLQAITGQCSK